MNIFNYIYFCDRCKVIPLSFKMYLFNRSKGKHYCNDCYGMLYLLKGKCVHCDSTFTNRTSKQKRKLSCHCGHTVYLTLQG